jgi:hypothetical protein
MPNKWLIVNGLKYPAEDGMAGDTVDESKKPSSEETKSFTWFGKEYEEVREISLEEALEFQRWVKENKDL